MDSMKEKFSNPASPMVQKSVGAVFPCPSCRKRLSLRQKCGTASGEYKSQGPQNTEKKVIAHTGDVWETR